MSKNVLLLLVGIVVVISGCINGGSGKYSSTQGVRINQFSFDIPFIYEGEEAYLTMEIENVGSKQTTGDTKYWIYGPEMGSNSSNNEVWRTNDDLSGTLVSSGFLPPTPEGDLGEAEFEEISLTAPEQEEGMEWPYTFNLRVCYPYTTTSTFALTKMGTNEYRSSGVDRSTDTLKRQSSGPIHIDMPTTGSMRMSGDKLRLSFIVTDVGGGFSTSDENCGSSADVASTERGKMKFTVKVDGNTISDCSEGALRLIDGSRTYTCKANVGSVTEPEHTFKVVAKAEYTYYINDEVVITVNDDTV